MNGVAAKTKQNSRVNSGQGVCGRGGVPGSKTYSTLFKCDLAKGGGQVTSKGKG